MATATLQDTRAYSATSAALAFEDAALRDRMRREAARSAVLEMAIVGLDLSTLPASVLEDAAEEAEGELAADPADHRAAALRRAIATLRVAAHDDADLPVAA